MKRLYLTYILLCLSLLTARAELTCADFDTTRIVADGVIGGTISATKISACEWTLTASPASGYKLAYWSNLYGAKSFEMSKNIEINPSIKNVLWKATFVRSNAYIHEWTGDSVVYRTDTTDLFNTASSGYVGLLCINNSYEFDSNTDVDRLDFGVWAKETSGAQDGNQYAGKHLHVVFFDLSNQPVAVIDTIVPVMVVGDSTASTMDFHSAVDHTDVQVFDGATLTIDADKAINGYLDIHAGGRVIVEEGAELDVKGIIMRGNGITKKWPQLEVNGTIKNRNNDTIYYDYTLDQHAYYPLTLPFDVNCSEVRNPINNGKSSYLSYTYNTVKRENGIYAWEEFDDTADGAKFEAGKGYTVYAVPTKWRGVKAKRQQKAIMRFPMVADYSENGDGAKLVDIYSNPSGDVYDCSNWNLIGNPYLKNITMGHVNVGKYRAYQGNLDGEGHFKEATPPGSRSLEYITYSDDGFRSYKQEELSNFVMKPFNCYLTQTAVGSKLEFAKITTPLAAPRRAQDGNEDETEKIRTGLLLTQGDNIDHIGLLFGNFTYDYEVNADLAKQFGEEQPMSVYSLMGAIPMAYQALPIDAMTRPISLGYRKADATSMTFSFDDSRYDRNAIGELWLTDLVTGETVNILEEAYTFMPESAQDDSRFYLSCERRKVVDVTTDVEKIEQQRTIIRVFDMFGREMRGDINSLPQGVYVLMDNLGNTKKEILGK